MNNKPQLTVYKSNQLIEAAYRLSLNEQRLILACIAQINSKDRLSSDDKFELSAKNFAKFFSISEDRSYSELRIIAKTLYERSVTIVNPEESRPELRIMETRWISSIGYIPEEGKIILCFAKDMLPYLSELKGTFTRYELKYISNMKSVYSIRLYELLMQWQSTGKREVEISWLKKKFQIEDKYKSIKDLKKYVLEPALKEINQHSNYYVEWTQRKTGRSVTHFTFFFNKKETTTKEKHTEITKPSAQTKPQGKLTVEKFVRENPVLTCGKTMQEVLTMMSGRK
jgi:plasmid replication initiation protein